MSRQNYYKSHQARHRKQVDACLLLDLIRPERALQPRIGCRKLLELIRPRLSKAGVIIGRDRFFEFMASQDLLIQRRKRRVTTTTSRHRFQVYGNQFKELDLTGIHQALVSDITYIRTDEGFVYLSLVMDAYSRKIVGYDCSDRLEAEGCLRALDQAIGQLPVGCKTTHHSDRGSQYCCYAYVDRLMEAGLGISMTEENHCYENAQAERLNGILKQEYALGETFLTKADAYRAVDEAVQLYNTRRPHQALGYRIPAQVHRAA